MYAGLTKLLDFDSTSGVIQDLTGLNILTNSNVTVQRIGKVYSAYFNGSTYNYTILPSIGNVITISLWYKILLNGTTRYLFSLNLNNTAVSRIDVYVANPATLYVLQYTASVGIGSYTGTIKNNYYQNLIIMVGLTSTSVAINGSIVSTYSLTNPIDNTMKNLNIGVNYNKGGQNLKGYIPKVQIFQGIPLNPALFATQVFNSQRNLFNV